MAAVDNLSDMDTGELDVDDKVWEWILVILLHQELQEDLDADASTQIFHSNLQSPNMAIKGVWSWLRREGR